MDPGFWDRIANIPDEELWSNHIELKKLLIDEVRCRLAGQRERNGESKDSILDAESILDPEALTIGFARRFAPYKRATLIFRDRDRLKHIISQTGKPVQFIYAGKSHPANQTGKGLIQQIYGESRNPEFAGRIIFTENYDMALSRRLLSGVDVWMNLPRRPLEASGTSGMKAAVNGALNLSVLDGWWPEAYNKKNGWAVGEERDYYSEVEQDESDSRSLYEILEHQIIPMYYDRDSRGISVKWLAFMKESMRTIIPRFNTYRMLEEYLSKMYLPAMKNGK